MKTNKYLYLVYLYIYGMALVNFRDNQRHAKNAELLNLKYFLNGDFAFQQNNFLYIIILLNMLH